MDELLSNQAVYRPDKRIALYWEDYTKAEYWERNTSWAIAAVDMDCLALSLAEKDSRKLKMYTVIWLSCAFDNEYVTEENMHRDNGHVPYKVHVGGNSTPDAPDKLAPYMFAVQKVQEVVQWLETNPVVDGLHLSQHRWNAVAKVMRSKHARECNDAELKMSDPAFTRTEAKAIMQALRDKCGSCGIAFVRLKGRNGSAYDGRTVKIEADATWVKSTGHYGGTTTRVGFQSGGFIIKQNKLLSDLQEKFSANQNRNWKELLK